MKNVILDLCWFLKAPHLSPSLQLKNTVESIRNHIISTWEMLRFKIILPSSNSDSLDPWRDINKLSTIEKIVEFPHAPNSCQCLTFKILIILLSRCEGSQCIVNWLFFKKNYCTKSFLAGICLGSVS